MVYPVGYPPWKYNVLVAIYHDDGTVAVSHGGIEMGQGINTKVIITFILNQAKLVCKIFVLGGSSCSQNPWSRSVDGVC